MTLEQEIERGHEARRILESTLYREAVDKVQGKIFDDFASSDPSNPVELQMCRLRLKCLAEITRELKMVMETGLLAGKQIEQERTIAQRMKESMRGVVRRVF
jgi:hypothetical protein